MASKLASQLQALAVAGGASTSSKPSSRPSLLFHASQAADIDLQTIFTLSQTGLDELVSIDGRFKPFKKTLFSIQSSQIDRELQSKEHNAKLNKSITAFLRLLSGYVMLTSAHQTLEYLIRRYKIQVYNVEDVVLCVLPYHETSIFVRVVQLLQIKNTRWQFLEAVQSTGAAPPRAVLVQRCTHDMALVESVCELAMVVSGVAAKSKTTITFTSVVLIETLAEVPTVSTDLVNRILPFILHSFNNGVAEEYRVGALMIIGALSNRCSLAPSLVETLSDHISRAFQRGAESEGHSVLQLHIMVLIQLVQTQQVQPFPSKSFKTLLKVRDFIPILAELVNRFDSQKFLTILVQVLIDHIVVHEHYEYLFDVIKYLPVGSQMVPSVLRLLEISFGEGDQNGSQADSVKSRNLVKKVLLAVEKRFPAELDKAISLHFQKSKVQEGRKNEDLAFVFLSDVFHGSLRIPLAETHMSLYLSLDHPQASVREIAIKQLSKLAATQELEEGAEVFAVLREAFFRRLSDDDYNVVHAVLLADNLVEVLPAERLFPALASIISRCHAEMMAGERSSKGDVKVISRLAVELLATKFLAQYPRYLEQVAVLFLEHVLQRPSTWRLNRLMLRVAGTIPFLLFKDLSSLYEETPFGADEEGAKSKDKRRLWQITINAKIIKSLAFRLLDDSTAFVPLLLKSSLNENSKLLVVLILLECLKQHPAAMSTELIDASLQWLRDEWAIEGSGTSSPAELQTIDYTKFNDSNSTPPNFYNQLEVKSKTGYTELLLRALYSLVICVPYTKTVKLESDVEQDPLNELFVLFAGSSSVKVFTPHVDLLLSRVPVADTVPFLSKFFITEGSAVPAFLQIHSVNALASQLANMVELKSKAVDRNIFKHLQSALPPLLVALASPLKAVRRSAIQCVEDLSCAWEKHSSGKEGAKDLDAALLNPICFQKILEIIVGAKAALISNGTYLEELWKEKYGIMQESSDEAMTGDADEHRSIIIFFVDQTMHLTLYGQRVVFKVLEGMGHSSELVRATQQRLNGLVERRKLAHLHGSTDGPYERLTQDEVQLMEVLLQMYTPSLAAESSQAPVGSWDGLLSAFFHCLTVEGGSLTDRAVLQPCLAALTCLTPQFYNALGVNGQDIVFQSLISLSTANSETLRSSANAALRILQICASTVAQHLDHLLEVGSKAGNNERRTKRRKATGDDNLSVRNSWPVKGQLLPSTSSILEFMLWKSDMIGRERLLAPLFKLLKAIIGGVWPQIGIDEAVVTEGNAAKGDLSQAAVVLNAQHLIFMILERIVKSLSKELTNQKDLVKNLGVDVDTIVISVNKAEDGTTRNHALSLLTSLGKLIPDAVLKHLIDVLSVVGESTLTEDDSHSHQVVYQMLTAVVPGWLAVEKDPTVLLEIFVSALPRIPSHRRIPTITNLLRVTSVEVGLHVYIFLLLQKARDSLRTDDSERKGTLENEELKDTSKPLEGIELEFAATLFRQYSPGVKLPAMVRLLDITKVDSTLHSTVSPDKSSRGQAWALQQLATQFVANQLQGSELSVGGQLTASSDSLQKSYVALMEHVLLQLQTLTRSAALPTKLTKGAQEAAVSVLDGLTLVMASTDYIRGISSLMKHSDTNMRRKVLRMYSAKIKELSRPILGRQTKKKRENVASTGDEHLTDEELELRVEVVKDITSLLAGDSEEQSVSTKLAAIDALNMSAQRFAERASNVFVSSLAALVTNLQLKNRALGAAAVRCIATILAKLGPLALPALPDTVSTLLEIAEQALAAKPDLGDVDSDPDGNVTVEQSELIAAILDALEAMLDKLGAFLTPYLERIVGLVLLRPQLILDSQSEIYRRATTLRTLLPTRIPARLLLDPLLGIYGSAVEAGDDSACALFDMLAAITAKADRPSVAAYHGRIFEFCLTAFDLRSRDLSTLQSVSKVETALVNAVVSLVMKLSETTFKPLFVKILEWAESETETKDGSFVSQSVDRNIVFYKLVNQLTSKLRSVFVPYLQYLINGCVYHLTGGVSEPEVLKPKKKKKKQSVNEDQKATLTPSEWHLRQLILSSLHQCFLYDSIGFLDAPKFQLLLGPIVSQLVFEAPTEISMLKRGEAPDTPSLEEMDDTLVSCLGQMALTAGTDLLWKPLNHEVLMCTRVENVRTRLLGVRVVKFLAEHLKEEYLVLLPETIPFLAELLEDTELMVVAKTQEVVKFLEDLSGEDLSQYF